MIGSVRRHGGRRVVSPTLIGRATELDRLLAAVTDPPAVVTVQGEAGIGKARLVGGLAGRAELAGRRPYAFRGARGGPLIGCSGARTERVSG
jgi:hypothetical protein